MSDLSSFLITQRWPVESYAAGDILRLSNYSSIQAWLGRGLARPAVQRGLRLPARPA